MKWHFLYFFIDFTPSLISSPHSKDTECEILKKEWLSYNFAETATISRYIMETITANYTVLVNINIILRLQSTRKCYF